MSKYHRSFLDLSSKISTLWTVFLLGTLFHTQLALMPLFHGLTVAESHTQEYTSLDTVFWFMLLFFGLPMVAILAAAYHPNRRYRNVHFGVTIVYSALNLAHLVMDVMVGEPPYQLVLMTILFAIGLILNMVSYQWIQIDRPQISPLKSLA